MSTHETEYAAVAMLQSAQEQLTQKRTAIETQLASLALHLTTIEAELETEPKSITATVSTQYNEFKDDGYIGGYGTSYRYPQRRLKITATRFDTVYLAALAHQGSPVPTDTTEPTDDYYFGASGPYSSVYLENTVIDGIDIAATMEAAANDEADLYHHEQDKHRRAIRDMFTNTKAGALEIVQKLREQLKDSNPYADIPIKINHDDLIDALLRRELLKYCEVVDPGFSVEQVN